MAEFVYGRVVVKNTFIDFVEVAPAARKRAHSAPASRKICPSDVKGSGFPEFCAHGIEDPTVDSTIMDMLPGAGQACSAQLADASVKHSPVQQNDQGDASAADAECRKRRRRRACQAAKAAQKKDRNNEEAAEAQLWEEFRIQNIRDRWQMMGVAYVRLSDKAHVLAGKAVLQRRSEKARLVQKIDRTVLAHVLSAMRIDAPTLAVFMGMGTIREGDGSEIEIWWNDSLGEEPVFKAFMKEASRFQKACDDGEFLVHSRVSQYIVHCSYEPMRTLREFKKSASIWFGIRMSDIRVECLGQELTGDSTSIFMLGVCPGSLVEVTRRPARPATRKYCSI